MQRPAKGEVAHILGRLIGPRLRFIAYFHNHHTFSLELGPLNVHPMEEICYFDSIVGGCFFSGILFVAAVCLQCGDVGRYGEFELRGIFFSGPTVDCNRSLIGP